MAHLRCYTNGYVKGTCCAYHSDRGDSLYIEYPGQTAPAQDACQL